jgi:hypothetical protein
LQAFSKYHVPFNRAGNCVAPKQVALPVEPGLSVSSQ